MGASVYYGLDVRRPEDLKELVEFATEITKEWCDNMARCHQRGRAVSLRQ